MNLFKNEIYYEKKYRLKYKYLIDTDFIVDSIIKMKSYSRCIKFPKAHNISTLFNDIYECILNNVDVYSDFLDIKNKNFKCSRSNKFYNKTNTYSIQLNILSELLKNHCILHGFISTISNTANTNFEELSLPNTDAYTYIDSVIDYLFPNINDKTSPATSNESKNNLYIDLIKYLLIDESGPLVSKMFNINTTEAFKKNFSLLIDCSNRRLNDINYSEKLVFRAFIEFFFGVNSSPYIFNNSYSDYALYNSGQIKSDLFDLINRCPAPFVKNYLLYFLTTNMPINEPNTYLYKTINEINNITIPVLEDIWDVVTYDIFKPINKNTTDNQLCLIYETYINSYYYQLIYSPTSLFTYITQVNNEFISLNTNYNLFHDCVDAINAYTKVLDSINYTSLKHKKTNIYNNLKKTKLSNTYIDIEKSSFEEKSIKFKLTSEDITNFTNGTLVKEIKKLTESINQDLKLLFPYNTRFNQYTPFTDTDLKNHITTFLEELNNVIKNSKLSPNTFDYNSMLAIKKLFDYLYYKCKIKTNQSNKKNIYSFDIDTSEQIHQINQITNLNILLYNDTTIDFENSTYAAFEFNTILQIIHYFNNSSNINSFINNTNITKLELALNSAHQSIISLIPYCKFKGDSSMYNKLIALYSPRQQFLSPDELKPLFKSLFKHTNELKKLCKIIHTIVSELANTNHTYKTKNPYSKMKDKSIFHTSNAIYKIVQTLYTTSNNIITLLECIETEIKSLPQINNKNNKSDLLNKLPKFNDKIKDKHFSNFYEIYKRHYSTTRFANNELLTNYTVFNNPHTAFNTPTNRHLSNYRYDILKMLSDFYS